MFSKIHQRQATLQRRPVSIHFDALNYLRLSHYPPPSSDEWGSNEPFRRLRLFHFISFFSRWIEINLKRSFSFPRFLFLNDTISGWWNRYFFLPPRLTVTFFFKLKTRDYLIVISSIRKRLLFFFELNVTLNLPSCISMDYA